MNLEKNLFSGSAGGAKEEEEGRRRGLEVVIDMSSTKKKSHNILDGNTLSHYDAHNTMNGSLVYFSMCIIIMIIYHTNKFLN